MRKQRERELMARAVSLGESGQAEAVMELLTLLRNPSAQVRRLAVSALGKLAGVAEAAAVVPALIERLRDPHPQVRQYAIKAVSAYGAVAEAALPDLQDIADRPTEKDYNRRDAEKAIAAIREAKRIALEEAQIRCQRCERLITADEYARAMRAFQRPYCDACFNEVYLRRRNFDTQVELNKTISTADGRLVQSDGERIIADFLMQRDIAYRYDERLQIIDGYAIRPDFYLPEFDVYIEYWGMDTADYKIGMLKKQKLYQQQGKRLISLHFRDKHRLSEILAAKLSKYVRLNDDEAQRSQVKEEQK
jgi:hypothetical protein